MDYDLHLGDMREVLRTFEAESIDSIVSDPPYGLSFMGKGWDRGVPGVEFWQEALRVAKPGAHLLAFGGTRTYHRLMCAIEDAGWEIRDCIMWVYGSGFPKGHNIGKAIDKAAGAEREVVGVNPNHRAIAKGGDYGAVPMLNLASDGQVTVPATDAAKQWDGWGTTLKPAWEPIIVARKPLEGTVAQNVLKHGTGGINIDGCRIPMGDEYDPTNMQHCRTEQPGHTVTLNNPGFSTPMYKPGGRWPANLIHDGSDEVVGLFPNCDGVVAMTKHASSGFSGYPKTEMSRGGAGAKDSGSAARFFYCAKASKRDRNDGLDGTHTVKYDVPKGASSCKDASTVLVALLRRATCESTVRWHIAESGESIMGRCPSASLSTTATEISRITESKILSLLTPSLISDCIAGASCGTANGGSRVASAERSSESQATITPERMQALVRGVRDAVSPMLSTIKDAGNWRPASNIHSTVKPTDLMRYCVKLVTPPGGVVLDPFMGSGSTGKAAMLEGMNFIGVDLDPEYLRIADSRISHALKNQESKC